MKQWLFLSAFNRQNTFTSVNSIRAKSDRNFAACVKDGRATVGKLCYAAAGHADRKYRIIIGVLAPVAVVISMLAFFRLLKWPDKSGSQFHRVVSLRKELPEAAAGGGGFECDVELARCGRATICRRILGDGSCLLVHKIQCCHNDDDLVPVLARIQAISAVVHRNVARIVGCYIKPDHPPLTVYECATNGRLLNEYLCRGDPNRIRLDWSRRMNIAAETARTLAFLQCEVSPPIFHHELGSSYVLIGDDHSVKIFGFELPDRDQRGSSVYGLGLLLLEIISGASEQPGLPNPAVALQKISNGMLEEIVDPMVGYHEQPPSCREQIEMVADIATRCLLFGGEGGLGVADVAKELVQAAKVNGHRRGPGLEETFSNSSLLQMISMSPDSIYSSTS